MPDSAEPRSIPTGYVLCFDFGLRRIGCAVGQATTRTASKLEVIANSATPDWAALDRLVKEWKPSQFLVGLPLDNDGEETTMSAEARRFGATLASRYSKDCFFSDERFSSRAAGEQFAELRASGQARRKHARELDSMAAKLILQNWLQSLPAA